MFSRPLQAYLNLRSNRTITKRHRRRLALEILEDRTLPAAPALTTFIDSPQITSHNQALERIIAATDTDTPVLEFSARAGTLAYLLDQELGLQSADGTQFTATTTSRFFRSSGGPFFIQANGDFFEEGSPPVRLAQLDPIYFQRPQLLSSAEAKDPVSVIDQALGLENTGNLWEGWGGAGERWLLGSGGKWYFIKPDGDLFEWHGSQTAGGTLLASLDPIYFANVDLLADAVSRTVSATLADIPGTPDLNDRTLTVDPHGYVGSFLVAVSVSDGTDTVFHVFGVTSTNDPPALQDIGEQTLAPGTETYGIDPFTASDGDNPPDELTCDPAPVVGTVYFLDQDHGFHFTGNYHFNWGGEQEKWFVDSGRHWFFIRPSGQVVQWDQMRSVTGTPLTTLDPIYYYFPQLLHDALPGDQVRSLDQGLGLYRTGNLDENWGGTGEKWLRTAGSQWVFIKPDGNLFLWDGSRSASGKFLTKVAPIYFDEIERLYEAVEGVTVACAITSPTAGKLSFELVKGFAGSFQVEFSVFDGYVRKSERFKVNVPAANAAPNLSGLRSSVTFLENSVNYPAAQLIDSDVTVTDADSANFDTGHVRVAYASGGSPEDQLTIHDQGDGAGQIGVSNTTVSFGDTAFGQISFTDDGTNGAVLLVVLNGSTATPAAVEALIENLTYQNASNTPAASRTIAITVADGAGGTSTARTTEIKVTAENDAPGADTTAPVVSLTDPVDGSLIEDTTPDFSGVGSVLTGDLATITIKIYAGTDTTGTLLQTLTATRDDQSGVYTATASPALPPGTYTAQAEQSDSSGNTGFSNANTFTVDTPAPVVSLTAPANGSSTSDTTPFSGVGGVLTGDAATITIRIYAGTDTTGTLLQTLTTTRDGTTGDYTVPASSALPAGTYTAQAEQSDSSGNTGFSTANTFTVDTTSPVVSLTAPANGSSTSDTTPDFSGVGGVLTGDSATITIKIYSGTSATGTPVQTLTATRDGTTGVYTVTASPALSAATYTAQAEQSDDAGNTGLSDANTFEIL